MRKRVLLAALGQACLFPSVDGLEPSDASSDATTDVSMMDAGDAGDAGARFCSTHTSALFCDDFDDASTISNAWTVGVAEDASLAVVQTAPVSPPNCLQAAVQGLPADTGAYIYRDVPITDGKTLIAGASVRIDAWPAGNYGAIIYFYTDQTHSAGLLIDTGGTRAPQLHVDDPGDAGAFSKYLLSPSALPSSGWFRFDLALHVTGATSTVDMLVNGVSVVGGPKPGPPISLSTVRITYGVYGNGYDTPLQWSFDDTYAEIQ